MIKNKKKSSNSKNQLLPKKNITLKHHKQPQKTNNTTKQITYATMEQTVENQDVKLSAKIHKRQQSRLSYLQRMEAHRLSPFSSVDAKSLTPKIKKSLTPRLPKEVHKKVTKKKPQSKKTKKITTNKNNQIIKQPPNNDLLNIQARRITQLTQEEHQLDCSIRKCPIEVIYNLKKLKLRKSKGQAIGWMRARIISNYIKIYPTMTMKEINLISAIIVVQRLWRQSRVKRIISQYLTPKTNPITYNSTFGKDNNEWLKNLKEVSKQKDQFLQLSSISLQKQQLSISKIKITEQQTSPCMLQTSAAQHTPSTKVNLYDLQLSDEITKPNKQQIIKFVECYRELNLSERKYKKQRKNIFNLPQSLSQKCLMEKLYRKAFKYTQRELKLNLFPLKNQIKQQKIIKLNENKSQHFEMEQRFYTQQQDEISIQKNKQQIKEQLKPIQTKIEKKNTLQTITEISQEVIEFLLVEFLQEFGKKGNDKNLKKRRLPGLKISTETIKKYLDGIISHTLSIHQQEVKEGLSRINPLTFLRLYRIQFDDDLFQDQEEQVYDWTIVPPNVFFEYQQIFQRDHFKIPTNDQKYTNFLLGLVKIHNKSLLDCYIQLLQKVRTEKISYPWDKFNKYATLNYKQFLFYSQNLKQEISKISFRRLGKLHRKNQFQQQQNLRNNDKQQYRKEGLQWNCRDQRLQIRQQLSNEIWQELINEAIKQFSKWIY